MVLKISQAVLLALVLAGCKVTIKVPEHGFVSSESEAYNCAEETTCVIDVVDLFFDETFTAGVVEPNSVYVFHRWQAGEQTLCGGTKESCRLSTAVLEGSDALLSILYSDESFSLQPVFVDRSSSEHILLRLTGIWNYTHTWGSCSASGQIEQFFVANDGMYHKFTAESRTVLGVEPCKYFIAENAPVRTVGPNGAFEAPILNEYDLQDRLNQSPGEPVVAEVIDGNKYRVSRHQDGFRNRTTYTRVIDGPSGSFEDP